MIRKLSEALKALCSPDDRVVCALSGGADSVALLHGLLQLKEEFSITVAAAHFNHCLRGEESDREEAFVRDLCARWDVELVVGQGDPRTLTGKSLEEAARELRYGFLRRQDGLIATAHHADDQAETVLLNLLRGTGLKGLCAMEPKQGQLIRPLLEVTKAEILTYVETHDLPYCTDSSNLSDDALRNRLRHHVMPLLQAENPNLTDTLSRMTKLLRQEEAYLQKQVDGLLAEAAREEGYDCPTLLAADPVLRRRAIRQLLPNAKPAMVHVEAVEQLLSRLDGSAYVELPGGYVAQRTYDCLTFETAENKAVFSPFTLKANETVSIPELGVTVSLTGPSILAVPVDNRTTFALHFDTDPVVEVRPRQTGDTISLAGGRKTLKKWMIDRKIPAKKRDFLPVFADKKGVFAVFGLGAATDRTAKVGEQAWILQIITEEREL